VVREQPAGTDHDVELLLAEVVRPFGRHRDAVGADVQVVAEVFHLRGGAGLEDVLDGERMDLERPEELLHFRAAPFRVDPDQARLSHGGARLGKPGRQGARLVEDQRVDGHGAATALTGR